MHTGDFSCRKSFYYSAIADLAWRLTEIDGAGESALAALDDELHRRVYGLLG